MSLMINYEFNPYHYIEFSKKGNIKVVCEDSDFIKVIKVTDNQSRLKIAEYMLDLIEKDLEGKSGS